MNEIYDEWINNIVSKTDEEELIQHLHKHINELTIEDVDDTWMASIYNLIEIARRKFNMKKPDIDLKIQRLYQHWIENPKNMVPTPLSFLKIDSKIKSIEQKFYSPKDGGFS